MSATYEEMEQNIKFSHNTPTIAVETTEIDNTYEVP